ncbi:muscarinic acetylcholine receptor M1-like [Diadema antillarum]|uniref:muscarinic acetylcholine receptor M1-like n=1 Tax=Diadema antillarum TaxID=105358 RepID=UPI003A86EFF0
MNRSEGTIAISAPEPMVSYSFLSTVCLSFATIFTNIIIVLAFAVQKRLWTYTNYYIFNMTIADLLVGAMVMPIRSTIILYDRWVFGDVEGAVFLMVQNTSLGVSVMGVVIITIDRYLATFHPMKHYTKRSIGKAKVINCVTWLLPFVVWLFLNVVWNLLDPTGETTAVGLPRPNHSRAFGSALMVFCIRFAVPFVIVITLYIRIYLRVRTALRVRLSTSSAMISQKYSYEQNGNEGPSQGITTISAKVSKEKRRDTTTGSAPKQERRNSLCSKIDGEGKSKGLKLFYSNRGKRSQEPVKTKGESPTESRKAMRTLSFIVLTYTVTWLPLAVSTSLYSISPSVYYKVNDTIELNEVARWMSFSNSMFNPLAYAMAQPLIRETIFQLFCKRCR